MYDHLLFDADGTLFDFEKAESWALAHVCEEYGITMSVEIANSYSQVNNHIWEEFELGLITMEQLKVERFRRFFSLQGIRSDARRVSERYIYHLGTSDHLFPQTIPLLTSLTKEGYPLSLITNGIASVQRGRLQASNTAQYFSIIAISEELGIQKPHVEFFNRTCAKIRAQSLPCSRPLIIGDSPTSDITGGMAAHIDTCWYNPRKMVLPEGIVPTYEIDQLLDILPLLHNANERHIKNE